MRTISRASLPSSQVFGDVGLSVVCAHHQSSFPLGPASCRFIAMVRDGHGRAGLVRKFHRLQLLDGTVLRTKKNCLPICDWLAGGMGMSWRRRLTLIVL